MVSAIRGSSIVNEMADLKRLEEKNFEFQSMKLKTKKSKALYISSVANSCIKIFIKRNNLPTAISIKSKT